MLQSASWAASQEIPRISRNPKVHYRTHKRPPSVSILGQPNPVHISTSHLLEIHPNIIHTSTPRSPSLQFPHQDPIHPPLLNYKNVLCQRLLANGDTKCMDIAEKYIQITFEVNWPKPTPAYTQHTLVMTTRTTLSQHTTPVHKHLNCPNVIFRWS